MRSLLTEAWIGGCIALVFAGVLTGSAPLVGLGALVLGAGGAARLWARLSLERVEYRRELSEHRAFVGEEIGLRLHLANRKLLPVPWLEVRERLPEAAPLTDGHTTPTGQHGAVYLTRTTSLRSGDRLEWPLTMHALRRGYHRFGPARLTSGDLFGLFERQQDAGGVDTLVVYPRTYPLPDIGLGSDRPFGDLRGGRRIFPDPIRVIGVRDYVPGDPLKQVDWKATARAGRLQSRLYEPSRAIAVVVALDVMTLAHTWEGTDPVLLERGVTVAASIAQAAFEAHAAIGLLTNGALPEADRPIRLGTGRRPDQLARVLEALAGANPFAMAPLAAELERRGEALPIGASVVVVAALMTDQLVASLERLRRERRDVRVVKTSSVPWEVQTGSIPVIEIAPFMERLEADAAAEAEATLGPPRAREVLQRTAPRRAGPAR